jgi:hypothetical protein
MTLVVIPEECQSMPMTAPNDCAADSRDLLRRWLREPVPLVNDEGANRIRRSTEHEFVGQHHERRLRFGEKGPLWLEFTVRTKGAHGA